eukprot:GFUD01002118.1.p1 GENE.GFUD01002118.1~~GFUD01002118.1.p1  ORF type:complete len:300 (+),score=75.58 GFUD01002118.1:92-991(+)
MSVLTFERSPANLCNLPLEIVIKYVLPHVGAAGLNNLALVDNKWKDCVELFIKRFNTVVDLSKPCKQDLFNFITDQATNLVKLDLGGCLNSPIGKQHPENLENLIKCNKNLEEVYIPNTWISPQVVHALAWNSKNLKVVQLSSFKIRLYDLEHDVGDEVDLEGAALISSRKLWPCSCWGTELEMEEEFELGNQFELAHHLLPASLWGSSSVGTQTGEETEEKKLLNNLRLLRKNADFEDFAWQSMGKKDRNLMDPLNFHEYKCKRGLFYDGNNEQDDFFLHHMAQFFEATDSENSDSDE